MELNYDIWIEIIFPKLQFDDIIKLAELDIDYITNYIICYIHDTKYTRYFNLVDTIELFKIEKLRKHIVLKSWDADDLKIDDLKIEFKLTTFYYIKN